MARCDLCGVNAGLFKSRHQVCDTRAQTLDRGIREIVYNGALAGKTIDELKAATEGKAREIGLPLSGFTSVALKAADDAAAAIALKSPISQAELTRLVDVLKGFGYPEGNRDAILHQRLFGLAFAGMSNTLYEVQNDRLPYYDGEGEAHFNLHLGEEPIISAGKVTFAEERTISTGSRTYGGLSVPVGAGVYYHVGSSQNKKVSGLLPLDVGEMLITTRALYFGGHKMTMRISLAQVLRYESYVDGVGVCESSGPPKVFVPDYSGMDTGWFFFNLLSTLTSKLVAK